MARGRPKLEIQETPTKYTREYIGNDGVRTVWKFDESKNDRGPIEVELFYPKGYESPIDKEIRLKKEEKRKQKYAKSTKK